MSYTCSLEIKTHRKLQAGSGTTVQCKVYHSSKFNVKSKYVYQKSKATSTAHFDEATFSFEGVQSSDELMIELNRVGFLGHATLLGAVVLPVARYLLHPSSTEWLAIVDGKRNLVAELEVVLAVQRRSAAAPAKPPVVVRAGAGVTTAAAAPELFLSAVGDPDALADSNAFYDGDWKTVSGNWKEFSVDQLKFEGVGEPMGTKLSAAPVYLQLLSQEMLACKKWGLRIGSNVSPEGGVTVHLAIDVSDMAPATATACGIDKSKALVVRFQWTEPTHYMGAAPCASRKTLTVRQSSDDTTKLDGRSQLSSWESFGLWWTIEQRLSEHIQSGWQRFAETANDLAKLVEKEVATMTPAVRDILDMFEWPVTDRPLAELALKLAKGDSDEALNILFDDKRENELRQQLGLEPSLKPQSALDDVPDVDALARKAAAVAGANVNEIVPAKNASMASAASSTETSSVASADTATTSASSTSAATAAAPAPTVSAPAPPAPTTPSPAPPAPTTPAPPTPATASPAAPAPATAAVPAPTPVPKSLLKQVPTVGIAVPKKDALEKADSIYWAASEFVKAELAGIAKRCVICNAEHPIERLKPTICSNQLCSFQFTSFGLGVDVERELVKSPEIVDLLISFTAAGTLQPDRFNPFPDVQRRVGNADMSFGKDANELRRVITMMPNVARLTELAKTGELRRTLEALHPLLYLLLRWIVSTTLAHIELLSDSSSPPRHKELGKYQFVMRCAAPVREAQFRELCRKHSGSFFVWHGSGLGNWHNIVRTGLKNMSGTAFQSSGAAYGPGIYAAHDCATSFGYSGNTSNPWNETMYGQGFRCLALCEVVDHGTKLMCLGKVHRPGCIHSTSSPYYRIEDEDMIVTRFYVVFQAHESSSLTADQCYSYFSKYIR